MRRPAVRRCHRPRRSAQSGYLTVDDYEQDESLRLGMVTGTARAATACGSSYRRTASRSIEVLGPDGTSRSLLPD